MTSDSSHRSAVIVMIVVVVELVTDTTSLPKAICEEGRIAAKVSHGAV